VAEMPASARREEHVKGLFLGKALGRWALVLIIVAIALILGYLGLHVYLSHQKTAVYGKGWADILFYDVQLFVLSSAPVQGAGPFPLALGIARFLAPAATLGATVETIRLVLREQLRLWSAASASQHAVVTGDGPFARELAQKLCAEHRKVVLVSTTPVPAEQIRARHLLQISGDPTDPGVLRAAGMRRAAVLYACAELSTANAATALRGREISQAHNRPLTAFAQVRDAEISTALRARRIGAGDDLRFRLDFFAVEDIAARVLLDKHLLAADGTWPGQVVIVGFGRLGRAVLREMARRPAPAGSPLRVQIRGESTDAVSRFLDLSPAVRRNCSVTCDAAAPERSAGDPATLIFVCLPDNDDALNAGLSAAYSLTAGADRAVICMSQPSPFGAVLTGQKSLLDNVEGRLAVFEVIEEACVPERIREDLADTLARAIHQGYLDNCVARGESPAVNRSMRPWEELPADLKQSNIAQAARFGAKLDEISCAVVPESANASVFGFTEAELELLAQAEHQSWVDERRAQGYVYGPSRAGKQHPDMVDWQYLSTSAKDKDREAVRELPLILQRAGFQVVRLPGSRHRDSVPARASE